MKRIDGITPNGGAYSEIYYLDKDHNVVPEEKATLIFIRECNEKGELINTTYLQKDN